METIEKLKALKKEFNIIQGKERDLIFEFEKLYQALENLIREYEK